MQQGFILTAVAGPDLGPQGIRLQATDHLQREVVLLGSQGQQINIQSVRNQAMPLLLLTDQAEVSGQRVLIPETALIGIMPLAADALQGVLQAGQAEQLLARVGVS